ncbi:MAG: hypothetical protein SW019_14380 [Actinomycetota bacterium]|nr:hypothetical protein [Actinomycetota bacterium]
MLTAGLLAAAPPAGAGCVHGGPQLGTCDEPVRPDGTWQRCIVVAQWVNSGLSSHLIPVKHCDIVGPGRHPQDPAFANPPTHIDG